MFDCYVTKEQRLQCNHLKPYVTTPVHSPPLSVFVCLLYTESLPITCQLLMCWCVCVRARVCETGTKVAKPGRETGREQYLYVILLTDVRAPSSTFGFVIGVSLSVSKPLLATPPPLHATFQLTLLLSCSLLILSIPAPHFDRSHLNKTLSVFIVFSFSFEVVLSLRTGC